MILFLNSIIKLVVHDRSINTKKKRVNKQLTIYLLDRINIADLYYCALYNKIMKITIIAQDFKKAEIV